MLDLSAAAAEGGRCGRRSRPSRHAAARAPDVPSVRPLPVVGRGQRRDARREGGSHAGPGAPRRRLLAEVDAAIEPMRQFLDPDRAFPMSAYPNYEPGRETSIAASSRGAPGTDGGVLRRPHGRRRHVARPATVAELHRVLTRRRAHDARAPVERGSATVARTAATCDASTPTFMLTHWTRDRDRPSAARVGRAQDDRRRPRCTASPTGARRARDARRRQRHRL